MPRVAVLALRRGRAAEPQAVEASRGMAMAMATAMVMEPVEKQPPAEALRMVAAGKRPLPVA